MLSGRTVTDGRRTGLVFLLCLALVVAPVSADVGAGSSPGDGDPDATVHSLFAPSSPFSTLPFSVTDWPAFLGNSTRSGHVPGAVGPVTNVSVLWNATDDSFGPPVVDDGTVFALNGSAIKAFDADTGHREWQWEVPNGTAYDGYLDRDAAPIVVGDRVFALTGGYLLGFNVTTGALEVTYQGQHTYPDTGALAAVGDTLYFAFEYDYYRHSDINARVYAVGTDGTERWTRNLTNWVDDGDYVTATQDTVYVRNIWNHTAFDADTGALRWNRSFAEYLGVAHADDGLVYFTATNDYTAADPNDYVYAVDADTGATVWRFNVSQAVGDDYANPEGVSTDGTTVYVFDNGGTLYALDALTGSVQYSRTHDINDPSWSVVADGVLYASGADDGRVHAFDASNGDLLWNVSFPYSRYTTPTAPAVSNGTLYVGTVDGLVAIGQGVHYSGLSVSHTTPQINQTVTVSATVSNPQSAARNYTAQLLVNGTARGEQTGSLAPGAATTVTFTPAFRYPTDLGVTVGNHPTQADYDPVVVHVGPQPTGAWPHYRGAPNGTGVSTVSGPTSNLTHLWNATFDDYPSALISPVVADGLVFAGTDDYYANHYGNLSAYDAATGELVWARTGFEPKSTGTVAGGVLYVAVEYDDSYNRLYAVDAATGSVDWQTPLSDNPYGGSSPTVEGDTVYLGVDDGTVYAVNASDGSVRWTHTFTDSVRSTPAVVGTTVYVGDEDGFLTALNATSGDERWNVSVGYYASSPAVSGGTVYVGDDDLYAIDATTGTVDWTTHLPSSVDDSAPAVADGVVYVGDYDGVLHAIDATTGNYLWNATVDGGSLGPPVVADGAVYVIDESDGLWVFDASTGDELARYETYAHGGVPAVVDGYAYLFGEPDSDYALVAVRGETGTTPAGTLSVTGTTDFGGVAVGNATNATLTVKNTGTADVAVSGTTLSGADAGAFAVADGGAPFTLAPAATRDLNVTFTPTRAGEYDATLGVASNATTPQIDVALNGTGLDAALTPSPSSLSFGDVTVNATDSTTVTLTASGGLPVNVTALDISGADADRFAVASGSPTLLSAGASLDVTVAATPNETGAIAATLAVATDDAGIGTVSVPLSANGTAATRPDVAVTPASVDFGRVRVGTTQTRTVTVANDGDATLTVSGVGLTGSGAFSAPSAGFALSAGASRDVTVSFAPTRTGAVSSTLTVSSDDPDEATVSVPLSGAGKAASSAGGNSGNGGNRGSGGSGGNGGRSSNAGSAPSVTVTHDGSNTSVSVTGGRGGQSLDVNVTPGDGADVSFDGIAVNTTNDGDYTLGLSQATEDDASLRVGGTTPLFFLRVSHSLSNDDIHDVVFTFSISTARLQTAGIDPANVVLYRRPDGESTWTAIPTTVVHETPTRVVFRAVSPGFSTFSVAGHRPLFRVVSTPGPMTVGDAADLELRVTNGGLADGVFDASVTADGASLGSWSVTVPAGETRTIRVPFEATTAGDVSLAVNGESVASVSVSPAGLAAVATTESTTTESAGAPGFGPAVALVALLAGALLAARRRD